MRHTQSKGRRHENGPRAGAGMASRPSRRAFLAMGASALAGIAAGCRSASWPRGPAETLQSDIDPLQFRLMTRFAHVTDSHMIDTESPARLAQFGNLVLSSWRPYEAYAAHLLDGIIRAINQQHEFIQPIDFVIHTGDAIDNVQRNELDWFLAVLEGREVQPLSGMDDRPPDERPPPEMDPYRPFSPNGLYREGVHGTRPGIPWYGTIGNHDEFATGLFPVIELGGRRIAPLPLTGRPGTVLPKVLDPLADRSYVPISPARPGPGQLFNIPQPIAANPQRYFVDTPEIIDAYRLTASGLGFPAAPAPLGCYSVHPAEGLRMIVLNSSNPSVVIPTSLYLLGFLGEGQKAYLIDQLDQAMAGGEWVIVVTHHPADDFRTNFVLDEINSESQWVELLSSYPNVICHLCGHQHRNRVRRIEDYLEIQTSATIDYPQQARIVEIYEHVDDGSALVQYRTFSHLDQFVPDDVIAESPGLSDPLRGLRQQAFALAGGDAGKLLDAFAGQGKSISATDQANPHRYLAGSAGDRIGRHALARSRS